MSRAVTSRAITSRADNEPSRLDIHPYPRERRKKADQVLVLLSYILGVLIKCMCDTHVLVK
jgi:hypothetical protein